MAAYGSVNQTTPTRCWHTRPGLTSRSKEAISWLPSRLAPPFAPRTPLPPVPESPPRLRQALRAGPTPSSAADFALLPERERYIAGYVDRLPDGAAMDIKSLAKDLPCTDRWPSAPPCAPWAWPGTCATYGAGSRTSARTAGSPSPSGRAPPATTSGGPPTSTPRAAGPHADARDRSPPRPAPPRQPRCRARGHRLRTAAAESGPGAGQQPLPAYLALARLGRLEPRLALSAGDCGALRSWRQPGSYAA
ncbi:hypothetical protein NKH18_18945 [Streptomyces sp. M10(2022)]